MMLTSSAMQQLGKVVNPMTNKTEVDLEGAQLSIDMLEMLRKRTAGNLSAEERRLLTDSLSSLQMNYVETAQAAKAGPAADAATPSATEAPKEAPADTASEPGETEPAKEAEPTVSTDTTDHGPRFHKSYG
jgi:hypothetical protein